MAHYSVYPYIQFGLNSGTCETERRRIPAYGHTDYITKGGDGALNGEEAAKKSLTDATTKALSGLGFGQTFMNMLRQ
jgi:hypothetical protein